jgi:hypothetical protein
MCAAVDEPGRRRHAVRREPRLFLNAEHLPRAFALKQRKNTARQLHVPHVAQQENPSSGYWPQMTVG